MIRIYQKEDDENTKAQKAIDDLVEKNIKIGSIMIRATPIMECLTGFDCGFIFSGKLIATGEIGVNNFFLSCCDDVGVSTNKIISNLKYGSISRCSCF